MNRTKVILSIFLMLVLRNQALTFILLLGYIGLTLFYIQDKFYYLFDYMVYNQIGRAHV